MERRDELHRHGCSIAKQTILTTHPSGLQTRVSVELANFDAVCLHSECKTKKPTWESPFMGRRGLLGGVSANVTPVLGRRSDAVNEGRLSQQCTPVMRRREMDSPGGSPLPVRRELEEEGCDVDNSVISGWLKFRDNKRWKSRWGVVTKLSPAADVGMSFKDKVVIVTGASSGIGAAVAVAFSADGARVVMVGRNENKLAAVAARCNNPLVLKADVANDDDSRRIINQTIEHFGQIDILVNNAGISSWGNLVSGKIIDSYDKIMPVNLRAIVLLTSLATPYLIKTKGNVINISSIGGQLPANGKSGLSMYCVSKAALNHFGLCAAAELAPHGVRVNTISPGPVVTDIIENSNSSITWDDFKKNTALDRVSEPEEIADLVLFIASDKAKAITGSNQVSDNGTFIKRG